MTTKRDLSFAIALAAVAHHGQVDRAGDPMILHVMRVRQRVADAGHGESYQIAAVLHDVLEDCRWLSTDALAQMNLPADIVEAVVVLTRAPSESYREYIDVVMKNHMAMVVKRADLEDHLAPENRCEAMSSLIPRYELALARIEDALTPPQLV